MQTERNTNIQCTREYACPCIPSPCRAGFFPAFTDTGVSRGCSVHGTGGFSPSLPRIRCCCGGEGRGPAAPASPRGEGRWDNECTNQGRAGAGAPQWQGAGGDRGPECGGPSHSVARYRFPRCFFFLPCQRPPLDRCFSLGCTFWLVNGTDRAQHHQPGVTGFGPAAGPPQPAPDKPN